MQQTDAHILDVELEGNGPFVRIVLGTSEIARQLAPGRFVLADLAGFLREALFPARISAQAFDILVPPSHPAAALSPGASVSLIGPLGRGFNVASTARRLLLVAGAGHLPALLPLADPAARGSRSVALLLAARPSAGPYPLRLLPPSVEVHFATADGAAGRAAATIDVYRDLVSWADHICIVADKGTYATLAEIVREIRVAPTPGFAQALLAPTMACGVGACRGCGVTTTLGVKRACCDGPVFDLLELRWP